MLQRAQDNNGNLSTYRKTIAWREDNSDQETIRKVQTITIAHEEPGKYRDNKN